MHDDEKKFIITTHIHIDTILFYLAFFILESCISCILLRIPCFVSNFYFDYCNYIVLDYRDSRHGERKKFRLHA